MKSASQRFVLCALCLSLVVIPVRIAIADGQSRRIAIEYEPPKNPAHQPLYEMLKEHRVLEKLQEIFGPFQLPIELTFKTVGCDGVSNAWYSRPTVTICYEYLAEIQRAMPKETTPVGVTPTDAVLGQFFYAVAHETGHAMFDLLSVPIFGYQEDAADQFAGYIILQFGKADARRLILGAAHSYKKYVENPTVTAPLTAFSDEHSPPAQRFYNLLCLAYGADRVLFADFVEQNYLPKERSKVCRRQYGELVYAFHQLIAPHLDKQLAKQVMETSWLQRDEMPSGAKRPD
jgi:hypothetical protein